MLLHGRFTNKPFYRFHPLQRRCADKPQSKTAPEILLDLLPLPLRPRKGSHSNVLNACASKPIPQPKAGQMAHQF